MSLFASRSQWMKNYTGTICVHLVLLTPLGLLVLARKLCLVRSVGRMTICNVAISAVILRPQLWTRLCRAWRKGSLQINLGMWQHWLEECLISSSGTNIVYSDVTHWYAFWTWLDHWHRVSSSRYKHATLVLHGENVQTIGGYFSNIMASGDFYSCPFQPPAPSPQHLPWWRGWQARLLLIIHHFFLFIHQIQLASHFTSSMALLRTLPWRKLLDIQ